MQPTLSSAVADTPFRLHTAPSEAIAHPGWRQARAAVLAALGRGEAVVLLGLPGTGKTLLLQDLAQALRHEGWSVRLVERGDALHPALRADVLLVDEAGRMGADALDRLCATSMPFVLAALPGFTERLAGLPRPVTPVALEPLPPEEVARFVTARLSAAGRPGDMLEPDAVLALARHSAGLLRLVNVLGGAAVFLAELERAPRVSRRHVDEAASMRDGAYEDAAPTAPAGSAGPAEAAAPRDEAPPALRALLPARGRRAVLGAAAAGLGIVLAGGWAVTARRGAPPPSAQPGGPDRDAERPRDVVSNQPPKAQPDERGDVESLAGDASHLRQQGEQPLRPTGRDASPRPDAGASPRPRQAVPEASASYRGAVYNETLGQGGQMSLVIRRRGPPGAVTARFEAWGGLLGSGELAGTLSDDGRLSASGQLMVGRNPFICDLNGRMIGGKLTGAATFVRPRGGRISRSTFTLTRS